MESGSDSEDEQMNKTFIDDSSILDKYQAAAKISDEALASVVAKCVPGADINTLCVESDKFIVDEVSH